MSEQRHSDTEREMESLVDPLVEEGLDPARARQLESLLRDDPVAQAAYVEQVRLHALLEWRSGRVRARAPDAPAPWRISRALDRAPVMRRWRWSAAALVLLAVGLAALLSPRFLKGPAAPQRIGIGSVALLDDVVWGPGQATLDVGSRVTTGLLSIDGGTLQFRSDTGATATVSGPARIHVMSDMRLLAQSGRVTVRVEPGAHGFTIDTPTAAVVDLGTEFGIQVDPAGQTDVVVFEGSVDVARKPPATTSAPQRLTKGEGVRINREGRTSRIVSVDRRAGIGAWSIGKAVDADAVIASVHDDIADTGPGKYYQIVRRGLNEDVRAYVDRSYEWNGVTAAGMPRFLLGADLVQTFNDDKRLPTLSLTVTLARPAMLYVLLYEHAKPPEWLVRDFTNTGKTIGLDEGPPDMPNRDLGVGPGKSIDRIFTVWQRRVTAPGDVTLGGNDGKSMYGIAAVPLE